MKKNPDFPTAQLFFIFGSFALAILDMFMLYEKIKDLMAIPMFMAMITAFIIATIANLTALTIGYKNGANLADKVINKNTKAECILWLCIGLGYALIRGAWIAVNFHTFEDSPRGLTGSIVGEIVQIGILAISYIGTGIAIQESMRNINDADCVDCRRTKKKFMRIHDQISSDAADLQADLGILDRYDTNYKTLKRQRDKIDNAISKAERGVMSDIVGKMCARHTEISPIMANKVMDEVIAANKREDNAEV